MPSGKVHTKINLISLPFIAMLTYLFIAKDLTILSIGSLVYLYGTFFLNPDADLQNQTKLFSIKGIMTFPTRLLYAPFFKHRGYSHTFLFGTTSRVIVLALFTVLVYFAYSVADQMLTFGKIDFHDLKNIALNLFFCSQIESEKLTNSILLNQNRWAAGAIGLLMADLLHLTADKLVKKRYFKFTLNM